jgi:hypothetical protein
MERALLASMTIDPNCDKCSPSNFGLCLTHNYNGVVAFVSRPYTSQMERSLQQTARKLLEEHHADD